MTALHNEQLDLYIMVASDLFSISPDTVPSKLEVSLNNLVFMDDSTLISFSKRDMEHMLSITKEFYSLNNTLANHKKYVLFTTNIARTPSLDLLPVQFNLCQSTLNSTSNITITPLPLK